jgi:hypothetical protein
MDYTRLSREELQRILDQNPADVGVRVEIKEELGRRGYAERRERRWTRHDKLLFAALPIALLTLVAAVLVVRPVERWLWPDKRDQGEQAGHPQTPSRQAPQDPGVGIPSPSVPSSPKPVLGVELRILFGGPELRVFNEGQALAQQINVDVVAWQATLYGVEFSRSYSVRDLIPNADFTIERVFGEPEDESDSSGHHFERNLFMRDEHLPISGYFVVTCSNCSHPRAWAFAQPRAKRDESGPVPFAKYSGEDHPWPLIEFEYPREKPKTYQCVNIPPGVCGADILRYKNVPWSLPARRQSGNE